MYRRAARPHRLRRNQGLRRWSGGPIWQRRCAGVGAADGSGVRARGHAAERQRLRHMHVYLSRNLDM